MDYTFNGAVEWDIIPQSLGTDLEALGLEKVILDSGIVADNAKSFVGELTVFLSTTRGVKVPRTAPDTVKEIVLLVGSHEAMSPAEIWTSYMRLPNKLVDAWREAWKAGQVIFPVDVAQLPTAALTDEQADEAKNATSPLAEYAAISHSDS